MLHYFGKYGDVIGLDRYLPAIKMSRSHFSGELVQGDCGALPFNDNCFAMVAACEVLYHRNVSDVASTVRELVRVLQPGGSLLLVDSAYSRCFSAHDLAAHGVRRFTRGELVKVMEDAGLEVVYATYAYALLLPLVWLLRTFKALFGSKESSEGELRVTWKPLNSLVIRWFAMEAAVAGRLGLPFGLSVQVLGIKNAHPAP